MIRSTVGTSKLLVLVSGGVDSTVLLKLCNKALKPEQVSTNFNEIFYILDNFFCRCILTSKIILIKFVIIYVSERCSL